MEGEMGWQLKSNLSPSISSESRPEGHPHDGHRTTPTAVSRKKIPKNEKQRKPPPTRKKKKEKKQKICPNPIALSEKV
ncbi:MAG: hypothetical protein IJ480_00205 [Clostridia bacterium]|nr:hypothetical protein [Clostridia bacterium]